MSHEAIGQLIDRWITEPAFREELRANPEAAVRQAGVELSAEEWRVLRSIDWSRSDEELQLQMSLVGAGA